MVRYRFTKNALGASNVGILHRWLKLMKFDHELLIGLLTAFDASNLGTRLGSLTLLLAIQMKRGCAFKLNAQPCFVHLTFTFHPFRDET
jgi:hypothetical protein